MADVLNSEFSGLSVLVLDNAIRDFSTMKEFKGYASTTLRILSLSNDC